MFTGLIETIGKITRRSAQSHGQTVVISCRFESGPFQRGESISVDGVCVTVEDFTTEGFTFSMSPETLNRTALGNKRVGARVHLERALKLGDRLGGHIVQGHVDAVGKLMSSAHQVKALELRIAIPEPLLRYIVEKGSLAVQGVSLTVARLESQVAVLAIIPATVEATYLNELKPGDQINLEADIIAKYVESLLSKPSTELDETKLRNWGF